MMIEKVLLDYLNSALDVPCYMEVPEVLPEAFVVLEKVGSGRSNYISSATFTAQSYAQSLEGAATLNEAVKAALDGAVTLPEVSRAALNSDYNYTDTEKKRYRYQAVYDFTHYER